MKTIYGIIICLLASMGITLAQQGTPYTQGKNVPDLERWTEEQIRHWEDSVKNAPCIPNRQLDPYRYQ